MVFDELAEWVKLQMTGKNTRSCSTLPSSFHQAWLLVKIMHQIDVKMAHDLWKWTNKAPSETKLQNYTTIVVFQSNVVLHKQECETLCWSLLTIIFHICLLQITLYHLQESTSIKKHKQPSNLPTEVEKSLFLYRDSIGILQFHM